MKYLIILLFFFSAHSFAGKFEDICLKIGYENGSEKFKKCVSDLSTKKKSFNTSSKLKLAPKGDTSAFWGAMIIAPIVGGALNSTGSSSEISKGAVSGQTNSDFINKCITGVYKCSGF